MHRPSFMFLRNPRKLFLTIAFFAAIAVGAFLRLSQITAQVLVGDEWHPVHQLTYYSLKHIATSFGNADYSIPLVLYYWPQMKHFGVSELSLRLPMIVAGLLTLIAFPLALRNRIDDRTVAIFALLLAISPFVISYSRIGRPYAITLLGIFAAFWCLERALRERGVAWKYAAAYATLCGAVVWAHAICGPMLVAPLIALWWVRFGGSGLAWRPLIGLTALTGATMALAVLPPLLGDPAALAGKSGVDSITLETVYGAMFLWFGTGSTWVLAICTLFAVIGGPVIWRATPIVRWTTLGVALTVLALLLTRPWWVDRPLAFGRYLLPVVPLLLLATAAGIIRAADSVQRLIVRGDGDTGGIDSGAGALAPTLFIALPFLAACWATSPLPEIIERPNSYTQDSYFQYDYRKERNPIRSGQPTLPASPFWASLASSPPGSLKIAVAPFRYSTHEWPSALWERDSRQRVVPAYLWGACEATRHGEVPPDARFRFRNAAHLKSRDDLIAQGIDYLGYYLTPAREGLSPPLPHCEAWVRAHYGPPDHEDASLLVWKIRPDTAQQANRVVHQ